jgi:glyoxylate carboligase
MGNYTYSGTINADPLVDVYTNGTKTMYVLTVPDQIGRTATYNLDLGKTATGATIYNLKAGANAVTQSKGKLTAGKLKITVTETPVFVEAVN